MMKAVFPSCIFSLLTVIFLGSEAAFVSNSVKAQRKLVNKQYLALFMQDEPIFQGTSLNNFGIPPETILEIENFCSKDDFFQSVNPFHQKAVHLLTKLFMGGSIDDGLAIADYIKTQTNVNLKAWYHSLTQWTIKDNRMQFVTKPTPVDVTPEMFIPGPALRQAWRQSQNPTRTNEDECVVIDGSAGVNNGAENALWYFREDIMLNGFHMFYHTAYPPSGGSWEREDRRSELFYYLHREVLARYNAERLSNSMLPFKSLVWHVGSVLEEGYYPNLDTSLTGNRYSDREPNMTLRDVVFGNVTIRLADMEISHGRLLEACESNQYLLDDGSFLWLNNTEGIEIFGDTLEANDYARNPAYYIPDTPGIHNSLHFAISASNNSTLPGTIQNIATSFRDIIFYRLHGYINDMFDAHKKQLKPYAPIEGELPLIWPGVTVENVQVQSEEDGEENELRTFMNSKTFQLRRGLDHRGDFENPPFICAQHLDHEQFSYRITVNNVNPEPTLASVRIFLSPRFNENGQLFDLETQRNYLFNLDVFTVNLTQGENTIYRRSNETNVAVPWAKHFDELEDEDDTEPLCGCGWPMHLLLPKGKPEGMVYDLVVMVTNGVNDAVEHETNECQSAYMYCGLTGTFYPDAKPMAYPFDRLPYSIGGSPVVTLQEYVKYVPNMNTIQVTITHGAREDSSSADPSTTPNPSSTEVVPNIAFKPFLSWSCHILLANILVLMRFF